MSTQLNLREQLIAHQSALQRCRRCPAMHGSPVAGEPAPSRVLLVGQAPGSREIDLRRPFAWSAGKTLFGWFEQIGLDESRFRSRVYMAAVCRCFPGKKGGGGDRVPDRDEIEACADWLQTELSLLQPSLIIPVGRLAIGRFLSVKRLVDCVGELTQIELDGRDVDIAPLPHPSGASPWHRMSPGRELLQQALAQIALHPAWLELLEEPVGTSN